MPLSETVIRQAKSRTKAIKMFDGRGLYLLLSPNGSRGRRFKYRIDGREKLISLGIYPDVPLKLARDRREEARQQLAKTSPSQSTPEFSHCGHPQLIASRSCARNAHSSAGGLSRSRSSLLACCALTRRTLNVIRLWSNEISTGTNSSLFVIADDASDFILRA
jgi:hypothetical protein